mmetsp:Transcript_16699/g.27552  ORF Transcript_16699/g.27552 Transcript_16699/m.27552 type:complete len:109 (-) Transcript_16699:254-580(-)
MIVQGVPEAVHIPNAGGAHEPLLRPPWMQPVASSRRRWSSSTGAMQCPRPGSKISWWHRYSSNHDACWKDVALKGAVSVEQISGLRIVSTLKNAQVARGALRSYAAAA